MRDEVQYSWEILSRCFI